MWRTLLLTAVETNDYNLRKCTGFFDRNWMLRAYAPHFTFD